MRQTQSDAATRLKERIAQTGAISVADFMAEAGAHYYAHHVPFGVAGDFTTAPEISQMFGELVAACLADAWMQAGKPANVRLVELGPGRGTLAADMLRTLARVEGFLAQTSMHLVETSATLRAQQATALAAYQNVQWHDRVEDVPAGFTLLIANEFFDALPFEQYVKTGGAWQQRAIGHDEAQGFYFTVLPPEEGANIPPAFKDAPDDSVYETSKTSLAILDVLTTRLAQWGGCALIVDYGYTAPALGDTLQSLRRHTFANVLDSVGEQDITAHVDFSALRGRAEKNVDVFGPVAQGDFLGALGIMARAEALCARATPQQRRDVEQALYRLTAPSEMGTLFKVLGLTQKNGRIKPAGF